VVTGGPLWAGYVVALGYLAGRASADRPWLGILGAAAALTAVGLAAEGARRLRARRGAATGQSSGFTSLLASVSTDGDAASAESPGSAAAGAVAGSVAATGSARGAGSAA
jgi:hypothetical protein